MHNRQLQILQWNGAEPLEITGVFRSDLDGDYRKNRSKDHTADAPETEACIQGDQSYQRIQPQVAA